MKCTTVLHGGVCHHASTPHKSGNKMKEKKRNTIQYIQSYFIFDTCMTLIIIHFKIKVGKVEKDV